MITTESIIKKQEDFKATKQECLEAFTYKMDKLMKLIQEDAKLSKQLKEILAETKYDFVHLDYKSIGYDYADSQFRKDFMLVLSWDKVRIMKYFAYDDFLEKSLEDTLKYMSLTDLINMSSILDTSIRKAEKGELQYYL